jgi:hypothetical protein
MSAASSFCAACRPWRCFFASTLEPLSLFLAARVETRRRSTGPRVVRSSARLAMRRAGNGMVTRGEEKVMARELCGGDLLGEFCGV